MATARAAGARRTLCTPISSPGGSDAPPHPHRRPHRPRRAGDRGPHRLRLGSLDGSAHAVAPAAATAAPSASAAPTLRRPLRRPPPRPSPARRPGEPAAPATGRPRFRRRLRRRLGRRRRPVVRPRRPTRPTRRPPAPQITSFRVVQQPTCPVHGTPDAPYSSPGTDVVIAWTVTGAKGAAIAVDNPGIYGRTAATTRRAASCRCPSAATPREPPPTSYTVWPAGAHDVSRTITASAHSDG